MMAKTKTQEKEIPTIIDDSILAGLLKAFQHEVIPHNDERNYTHYSVYGDVKKSLQEIYTNKPIGSLDVLNSIKACRSMIYNLREGRK